MKLWEAMKALQEGKKIRNKDWVSYSYLSLNKDGIIVDENGDNGGQFLDSVGDEWELYVELRSDAPEFYKSLYYALNTYRYQYYNALEEDEEDFSEALHLYFELVKELEKLNTKYTVNDSSGVR